ncbi:baseplate multidomain protein megatron [Histidinibacterium lentulum]|uniref:Host specificity protein n=1 Tax=Histidinibacterium lentulum TaxID=2480588 RepID=A0A3N2R4T8_9RHOB|nr:glycoside hydrolase/phage tail family protein [Histidinibacterium lentulum]ROU02408.1 host specificity protein [Histidinibacterium lentulum]
MATIVLGAAGMALGNAVGGSFLGLHASVIGRAAGATLGRVIDARLMGQGSEPVETGRVDRFRLTGASEGAPVGRVHGRMRVPGQVIWASAFREEETRSGGGGGKGRAARPASPEVVEFSYSVSLAVALCEGEVTAVGRIWADGREVPAHTLNMRLYPGSEHQLPDPKIEAVEGAGLAPAYRGVAYVLFEDLALAPFGNRVPSFSFEVIRPGAPLALGADGYTRPDVARAVRAVALMPGSGEYALATEPVTQEAGWGETRLINVNTPDGRADAMVALDQLRAELPRSEAVSLIVSWFGDDLRADVCTLRPKVEHHDADGDLAWTCSGLSRGDAAPVPHAEGGPVYGGTPTDQSVVQMLRELKARGQHVTFYPFILMDQMPGNTLPDPYTGQAGQPHLPWRGRITTSLAWGRAGSPQETAAADAEVAAFMGTCAPGHFVQGEGTVGYAGPEEWSYRRFILHYAHLCAVAGGVDAFCIGSEMRELTTIRGQGGGYPAVAALRQLAAEVRAILTGAKIGYAADWSEYHGHQPEGTGDKHFHLDPLWADPAIDFIGIDNYMPLSDWRDGEDHADAVWGSIHNLAYLRANVAGGEGYDWYYASDADRAAQLRTPISDHLGEPWLWRYKDLPGWWSHYHHDRVNGQRAAVPTAWTPGMKPIWFTEFGCAAIDKGTNQPNKFLDPKSSESTIPHFSDGRRDELIQLQYVRAMMSYWENPANNPVSPFSGLRMLDMGRAHYWAWDARPWPAFPGRADVWSDGANWERGHWITGRTGLRPLSDVLREVARRSGLVGPLDTADAHGLVRGYALPDVTTGRAALQPLMLAHGVDAIERDGRLVFRSRNGTVAGEVGPDALALSDRQEEDVRRTRAAEAEVAGRVRLGFVSEGGDFEAASVEVGHPGDASRAVSRSDLPMALTRGEAEAIARRWLSESRAARDSVSFALPPSASGLGAGDVVALDDGEGRGLYRIDRAETGLERHVEATRVDGAARAVAFDDGRLDVRASAGSGGLPTEGLFLDLPVLTGDEVPHAPWFAAVAKPWGGPVALYESTADHGFALNLVQARGAVAGLTETPLVAAPPGRWDRGRPLRVRMLGGVLASVTEADLLAGANLAAVGDGTPDGWEVIQFARAELVAPGIYDLSLRLRGQAGSDGGMPPVWPAGSIFIRLDGRIGQMALPAAARGLARHLRWGPAERAHDHRSYRGAVHAFRGNGLRPWAVAHLRASVEGGDLAARWTRRTRIGGDGWDGPEVPLGEERELYRIELSQGGTLLRTLDLDGPSCLYTAAQRSADGGATGPVTLRVAQVSVVYGPGPARAVTVG